MSTILTKDLNQLIETLAKKEEECCREDSTESLKSMIKNATEAVIGFTMMESTPEGEVRLNISEMDCIDCEVIGTMLALYGHSLCY